MGPLRSLLNTPADRAQMVEKAPGYGADALILDLEDSVALSAKGSARHIARDAIERWRTQDLVVYVRVNALDSGLLDDDLDAITTAGLAGIQVPKVDAAGDVLEVDRRLAALERERGRPIGGIELLVSLESARGVQSAFEILSASPRVGSVMVGTARDGDLQGDVGYETSEDEAETLYIRSRVLLAARAAGLANPIDGVYADVRDDAGLEASARRARALGYRGKKLIHPGQIEVVHRVFTPTDAELERYRRVVAAFEASLADGHATTTVDGRMIDYAMLATARRVLARAEAARPQGGTGS